MSSVKISIQENELSDLTKEIHKSIEDNDFGRLYYLLLNGNQFLIEMKKEVEEMIYEVDPNDWEKKDKIQLNDDIDIDECDPTDDNKTALHKSVIKGNKEIVKLLLLCGADPNSRVETNNDTCLHVALRADTESRVAIYHLLLRNGGNFELKNDQELSAMELAVVLDDEHCTRLMMEYGADVTPRYSRKLIQKQRLTPNIEKQDTDEYDIFYNKVKVFDPPRKLIEKGLKFQKKKSSGRSKKWQKMLKTLDKNLVIDHKKTKKRIRKGIPNDMRKKVWKHLLPIEKYKRENERFYFKLRKKPSPYTKQIDLDINRTFRENRLFKKRYGDKQICLFNVLKAYSNYDTEVGYCQGMSSITALLLMYIEEEEDAFWFLVVLMNEKKYDLRNIFLNGFPKLLENFFIHERIMEKKQSKLFEHFQSHHLFTSMYATRWYMLMFLDNFPFEGAIRIWEIFFWEGHKIIFSFVHHVQKLIENNLIGKRLDQILPFTQGLVDLDFDIEKLVINATQNKIKERVIKKYRKKYLENKKKEEEEKKKRQMKRRAKFPKLDI